MEQQVTAATDRREVEFLDHPTDRLTGRKCTYRLARATNAIWRRLETALRDELPRCLDAFPPGAAIEAEFDEPAGLEQMRQHAPAGDRIRHVMQHARGLDQVEALVER